MFYTAVFWKCVIIFKDFQSHDPITDAKFVGGDQSVTDENIFNYHQEVG